MTSLTHPGQMPQIEVVAWDFDGVLNRHVIDGRFIWADSFEADIGLPLQGFIAAVFADFDPVMTGREDLRDRVARWASSAGYAPGADAFLSYWFAKDAWPDPEALTLMDQLSARGVRQVIATNNEHRRAAYIESEMGFASRVERIFASGRMGVAKPSLAFFRILQGDLKVPPDRILLLDDRADNVAAAQSCGWRAFHVTDASRPRLAQVLGL